MRADMAKVIVERPRRDHAGTYPRGKLKAAVRDLESAPVRESMGRGYATKELNENLQPLQRYVARQVGRPWRLVHAEIAQRLSVRSAVQKHVLDHLREIVVESVWWRGGVVLHVDRFGGVRPLESWGSWRRYFVCPKTGLLRVAPPRRWASPALPDLNRRVIDATRELRRIEGVWFEVFVGEIPLTEEARMACFDVVERRVPERPRPFDFRNQLRGETKPAPPPVLWQAGRYAVSKHQLSKRELREHALAVDLPNTGEQRDVGRSLTREFGRGRGSVYAWSFSAMCVSSG